MGRRDAKKCYKIENQFLPISAIKCPCPKWFPDDGTPVGTYDWDHYPPYCSDNDLRYG